MVVDFQGRSGPLKKRHRARVNLTSAVFGQAGLQSTFGCGGVREGGRKVFGLWDLCFVGGGFKYFFNFHPDPWGNVPN